MANEFLMKCAMGMLGNTLWLYLVASPAQVSMERTQNMPVYLFCVVLFTIVHQLVQFLCSVMAQSSFQPKILLLFAQGGLGVFVSLFLVYASK